MGEGMMWGGGSGLARGGSGGVGEGGGLTDVALASNDMMDEAGAVLLHQVDEAARPSNGRVDDGDLLIEVLGDGRLFVERRERDGEACQFRAREFHEGASLPHRF